MDYNQIIEKLSAALTPIIAITTAYIAYQQYIINKFKYRNELYEKRLVVYKGILSHLSIVMRNAKISGEDLVELVKSTAEKEFLFSNDIVSFIEYIYDKSVRLFVIGELLVEPSSDINRSEIVEEKYVIIKELIGMTPEVKKKFKKYLSVANL